MENSNTERLEAFEKMLKAIEKNYSDTTEKMEKLKLEGKTKTVTYKQLMSNKLLYQNMLSMYKLYDIID